MPFNPGDRVTIANPHPENAKWRGKTGTVARIGQDGMYELSGIERPVREKLLGVIACSADELKAA